MVKIKDKRLRTHCRICKKRVNLVYERKGNKIYFLCPKCGGHGELPFRKFVTKK